VYGIAGHNHPMIRQNRSISAAC